MKNGFFIILFILLFIFLTVIFKAAYPSNTALTEAYILFKSIISAFGIILFPILFSYFSSKNKKTNNQVQ